MRGFTVKLLIAVLVLACFTDSAMARAKPKKKKAPTQAPTYPNYNSNEYWLVGNRSQTCKFPNFATIQEAVDAAASGDTILVCPGTFMGALVDKELHFAPYVRNRNSGCKSSSSSKPKPKPKRKPKRKLAPTMATTETDSLSGNETTTTRITIQTESNSTDSGSRPKPKPKVTHSNTTAPDTRRPKAKPKPKPKATTDDEDCESATDVIIVGGPTQDTGGSNQDGFMFVDGSSGSTLESFVFRCTVPESVDDANMTRAISIYHTSNITITGSLIESPRVGVFIEASTDVHILGNRIHNVTDSVKYGGYGVVITSSMGKEGGSNEVAHNHITFPSPPAGAYPVGIFITAPGPVQRSGPLNQNNIHDNTIIFAEQVGNFFGILLLDNGDVRYVDENKIAGNKITGAEFGIVIWGASNNLVDTNMVTDVLFVAIRLQKSKAQEAIGNTLQYNYVDTNEFGVACVAGANHNMVFNNTAVNSRSPCPFYDSGVANLFERNTGDVPGAPCHSMTTLFEMSFHKKYPPTPR